MRVKNLITYYIFSVFSVKRATLYEMPFKIEIFMTQIEDLIGEP